MAEPGARRVDPGELLAERLRQVARDLESAAGALEPQRPPGDDPVEEGSLDRARGLLMEAQRELAEIQNALPRAAIEDASILVVDDDSVSRSLLTEFLGRYGSATGAASGTEALAAINRAIRKGRPFRLVFLDIMMPEMDGHEVLRRIRSLEEVYSVRAPAVVATTTARGDRETVLRARAAGSEAYFVKPLDLAKVGQWVESLAPREGLPRG